MPLLWVSIAFIAGTIVPLFQSSHIQSLIITGVLLAAAGILEGRLFSRLALYRRVNRLLRVPVCLLIAAFLGGMARGEAARPVYQPDDLAYYNNQGEVTILAVASQPVENHDKSTLLTVTSRLMKVEDSPAVVTGDAILLLPAGSRYEYGDLLEVSGKPETPPEREDFSYRQYLENRGVYTYLAYPRITVVGHDAGNPASSAIYRIRENVAQTVKQIMQQPEASFLSGILVGRDEDIPDQLKNAFQDTGTSHLVAISGFNITIVAGLILALAGRLLPKRWSVWAAIVILGGYTVMAGASPSVVRAAIMGVLAMVGKSIGRNRTAVNSLGLAAMVMVLFNPLILRDIGFQLSVAATAGILLIGAPLNDWFVSRKTSDDKPPEVNAFWRTAGDSVVITMAAQLTTLPFLLYHFHRYPLIGLLVNPFVLPVQPAAMIIGGFAAIAGMIWLPLGKIIASVAWIPLAYTIKTVEFFSALRGFGLINIQLDLWQTIVLILLVILSVLFRRVWLTRLRSISMIILAALPVVSLFFLLNLFFLHPDGHLHIQVFRQGNDLSSFIISPGGQHILVTNRPGDKDLIAFVDRRLPVFDKKLDAVIIPNATASSVIFIEDGLERFDPDWLLVNRQAGGTKVQSRLVTGLEETSLKVTQLETGQRFDLGRGAILEVLNTGNTGSAIRIVWGGQSVELRYGDSLKDASMDIERIGEAGVLVLDHPADDQKADGNPIVIMTRDIPSQAGNTVTVADGTWVEIRSDGSIFELSGEKR